jgi:hypothetical protein
MRCSHERWHASLVGAARHGGPSLVVLAVCVQGWESQVLTVGRGGCVCARLCARSMEVKDGCQLDVMLLYEVVSEEVMTVLLPINVMRNYALLQVGEYASRRDGGPEAGAGGEGGAGRMGCS